ncbi:MAG: hypothetical protein JWO39_2122, partial [Gemmatimonadetes bacterium]|nr:hypothetical protein [Gemmatimonadota bacterium]
MTCARTARALVPVVLATAALAVAAACSDSTPSGPGPKTRTYQMGFSNFPPAPDTMLLRRSVLMWIQRADAAILHLDVPWAALLAGARADSLVHADVMPIVQSYALAHLDLAIETDVTNGVNRTAEAPALVALGRSITEDTVQKLYAAYVAALDTIAQPSFLGLASETNLIRLAGPPGVYAAIVKMTNAAVTNHNRFTGAFYLYVSVQVEVAWGRLGGSNTFVGIDRDRADFPFITALGLSSYPYLGGFTDPAQIPSDYFSRLRGDPVLPVLITEGGWSSANIGTIHSSPALQAAWIRRASEIAENARALAWFQLSFTDINLPAVGLPADDPQLVPFVTIGLVDTALVPKPALTEWDSVFALPIDPLIPS